MSEREIVVRFDEINRLEVECPGCKAGILFDPAGQKIKSTMCPVCANDTLTYDLISKLDTFVAAMKEIKAMVKLRIKESSRPIK